MSAPIAIQPAAANDARPARPVVFQTRGGASAFAHRSALNESASGRVTTVEYSGGVIRAVEGGRGFEVIPTIGDDWEVREVSPVEIARRVQRGIRAAVERELDKAREYEAAGAPKTAARIRAVARELEEKLTVSAAKAVA